MNKGIDKTLVWQKILALFEGKLLQLEKNIAKAWQDAKEAPGAMESASDGRRREAQDRAAALEREKRELQKTFKVLQTVEPNKKLLRVVVGSLVEFQNGNKQSFYFLVPDFGGDSLRVGGEQVFTVSLEAPLGKALLGKKMGDRIEVNDREFLLLKIS